MRPSTVNIKSLLSSMASKCLQENIHGIFNAIRIMASAPSPLFISVVSRGERRLLHRPDNHKQLRDLMRDCGLSNMLVIGMIFNELIEAFNEGKIAGGSSLLLDRAYHQAVENNSSVSNDAILKNIISSAAQEKKFLPSGPVQLGEAESLLDAGRPGPAIYAIRNAEQYIGEEQTLQIWQSLAERLTKEGRFKWAGVAYESAAQMAFGQRAAGFWLCAAVSYERAGMPAEAGITYERAARMAVDEGSAKAYFEKALSNYRKVNNKLAMAHIYMSLAEQSEGEKTEKYYLLAASAFDDVPGYPRAANYCREMARACKVD